MDANNAGEATAAIKTDAAMGQQQQQQPEEQFDVSDEDECHQQQQNNRDGLSANLTLVNFVKGMIGSGILTLPIVFRQAGLWTAFLLVFIFAFLNALTMALLVRCAHHLGLNNADSNKRREKRQGTQIIREPLSYGEVMEAALAGSFTWARPWARTAKLFVNANIVLLLIGIGCIKYDFIVAHLRELFDEFTAFHASPLCWAFIILPPMVLLNFTRTLRRIAVLNSIGNVFMFGAYGIIFYHLLQSPHQTVQLPWFTNVASVFTACGTILYCFEGQAMVLPMENKMRQPMEMLGPFGVLGTGMALTAIFDAAVGFLGYTKFGDSIQGSVTLNLPPTWLLTGVKLVFTGISFLDYLLQQYVTIQMLWPSLRSRLQNWTNAEGILRFSEYLFRTGLVITTMFIAIFVPNLEQIMPLVGFSGGVFLAFVFPPFIDTFTFLPSMLQRDNGREEEKGEEQRRWRHWTTLTGHVARNGFFVGIGVFGSLVGLRTAIADILAGGGT